MMVLKMRPLNLVITFFIFLYKVRMMLHRFFQELQKTLFYSLGILLLFTVAAKASKPLDIELQRAYFTEARKALKSNDTQKFQQLRNKLKTYPLAAYLDIWQARQSLDSNNDYQVEPVIKRYSDIPETTELRMAWIKSLAERGQWPHVAQQLKMLNRSDQIFPKISLRSAWYNGNKKHAFTLLSEQWRKGRDIHTYAIPFLHPAWKKAGFPSHEDSYARIIYLGKHGKWKSLQKLKILLSDKEQKLLNIWQDTQKSPALGLGYIHNYTSKNKLIYPIIKDMLRRLSSSDIGLSWQHLKTFKAHLSAKQFGYLQRKIALRAAKQHDVQSIAWLASLNEGYQNNETRAWYVRMLLWQQKWQQAIAAIQAMPESQHLASRWLYWHGHALQALGKGAAAKLLFEEAAVGRGYYSFLSADRLGQPYRMGEKPVKRSSLSSLKKEAYIQRSYEWFQLHDTERASLEWNQGLRNASRQTWLQALQLAASWGWYERTIQAAARTGAYDALTLRFPLAYVHDVQEIAKQTGLESSLIWGVIRQESVFNASAVSHAGARGLMQLMPTTASYISKKYGLGEVHEQELFLPATNIHLGSLYLENLLKRFDDQLALAVAAYNAGPTRVKRWQEHVSSKDVDIWVELIPFNETRRYVQQVIAFTKVYDWRLQQQASGLLAGKSAPILSE